MFDHVFKPGWIGSIELKNRLVMAPLVTHFAGINGEVTQLLIDYHVERTKGGVGLQILEGTYIAGERGVGRLSISDDQMIPGLNELVENVHEWGGVIFCQLNHQGKYLWKNREVTDLSTDEIGRLLDQYEDAAARAHKAGFDGIEIHGAHGYLINQFLSPLSNKRVDRYGGSAEGRVAFAKEVIDRIRKRVGRSFPVTVRISALEKEISASGLEDTCLIAEKLEEAGADAIHVSAGNTMQSLHWVIQPMCFSRGCLTLFAGEVRKRIGIPVIAVGRINNPGLADQILAGGLADFVAMGRPLLADPFLPKKAMEGKADEIRMCTACNYCVGERFLNHRRLRCAINPEVGREREYRFTPATVKKRIFIGGGGPAGMEAARVLSQRGHEVFLYEKEAELGGNLRYACLAPHKSELRSFLEYLILQMNRLKVHVRLGESVDEDTIRKLEPDFVILGLGAAERRLEFGEREPGSILYAKDVLSGNREIGDYVVVIGGGSVGCEVAEFLVDQGKNVTIVEKLRDLAPDAEPITRALLLERLSEKGVRVLDHHEAIGLEADKVLARDLNGHVQEVRGETVVVTLGFHSDTDCYEKISRIFPHVFVLGDCKKPGLIADAVHSASRIARSI